MIIGTEMAAAEPGVLARLRAETRDLHKAVETRPLLAGLMSESLTRVAYTTCLQRLDQFHGCLEPALSACLGAKAALDLPLRRKSPSLRRDLAHFACEPSPAMLPLTLKSEAEAWGVLYVIEGATLGGVVITRHLARHDWLAEPTGRSHFAGYGARTGAMWAQFRAALVQDANSVPEFAEMAVAAARMAFRRLDDLMADWG